jgi:PadR family transcriptional regulator PadR
MKSESNFVNGIPELLILRLLEKQEMYGYQLVGEIQKRSECSFTFGEGCIYPLLHTMETKKWLAKRKETVTGRPRYYYRATAAGRKRLRALTQEWNRVQSGVQLVMGGQHAFA